MKMVKKQGGFTLVEIAIVLVIVGLLLAGVLKGQELIESSRIRAAVSELNSVTAANNAYIDRFRAAPGDDGPTLATLTARGGPWLTITAFGNLNGALLSTPAQTVLPTLESLAFWQHLRAAGFISGSPATIGVGALPNNSFGGLTGVVGPAAAITGANGRSVCMTQVPGKAARAIDTQLDDGVPLTGDVRATLAVVGVNTPPAAAPVAGTLYVDGSFYTVCKTM